MQAKQLGQDDALLGAVGAHVQRPSMKHGPRRELATDDALEVTADVVLHAGRDEEHSSAHGPCGQVAPYVNLPLPRVGRKRRTRTEGGEHGARLEPRDKAPAHALHAARRVAYQRDIVKPVEAGEGAGAPHRDRCRLAFRIDIGDDAGLGTQRCAERIIHVRADAVTHDEGPRTAKPPLNDPERHVRRSGVNLELLWHHHFFRSLHMPSQREDHQNVAGLALPGTGRRVSASPRRVSPARARSSW
jgi:hypothetical protein